MFTNLITSAIALSAVFLFGCVGEILTEKSGNLNLGIPGTMCMGAAGGCWCVSLYMGSFNEHPVGVLLILFGIVGAVAFAMFAGLIYSFLTSTLKCNQNITGLAITIFGTGFTQFFMTNFADVTYYDAASKIIAAKLPFASQLGWFGEVFLSYGVLTYLAIAIAVCAALFLNRTKPGLHLRAVGENPATADAAGISVTKYKYLATLIGSGIAGLGGFFYIMDYIGGSWENAYTIEALGWLSVALVIFTLWRPNLSILGSILFAMLYIFAFKINGISLVARLVLNLLPYVITIIVLIITSIFGSKSVQPPASLGLNYFREER
ncbi:MAG: ABC transporter permease [Clostridia bacterium]|nr:ABC transporter permease [Clostridia bacterium]